MPHPSSSAADPLPSAASSPSPPLRPPRASSQLNSGALRCRPYCTDLWDATAIDMKERRDWSVLLPDLLVSVAQHLRLADVARLPAVCGGWAWALGRARSGWPLPPATLRPTFTPLEKCPPLLLLPNEDGDEAGYMDFLRPSESESDVPHRIRISHLPEMAGHICVGGSPDGWIATVDIWLNPRILNPITREEFSLPSLFTLSSYNSMTPIYSQEGDCSICMVEDKILETSFEKFKYRYVKKIIISSAPHCIAFLIHSSVSLLAMARVGDTAWSPALHVDENFENVEDVVYNENDGKFYVLSFTGKLIILDLKNYQWGSFQPPKATLLCNGPRCKLSYGKKYVVFSSVGDLLQAWRHCEAYSNTDNDVWIRSTDLSAETMCIKVFKFDPGYSDSKNPASCWVHVNDLGDDAMFLGSSHSTCVPTYNKPCIRKNSVYFAEDRLYIRLEPQVFHARAGIFDLKSNKIERFFPSDSKVFCHPPAWFIPKRLQFIL